MKTTKRSWLIRIAFILVLVLVAVLMLRIGRGHTVYFDNRSGKGRPVCGGTL